MAASSVLAVEDLLGNEADDFPSGPQLALVNGPSTPSVLAPAPSFSKDLRLHPPTLIGTAAEELRTYAIPGKDSHVVQQMHAGTIFSERVYDGHGTLSSTVQTCFEELRNRGVTALYLVGIFAPSPFSKLVMKHHASNWEKPPDMAHVGPSVFSVEEFVPISQIGSWRNLERLAHEARHSYGIELVVDFIPNTIAVDSKLARNHPELICTYDGPHEPIELLQQHERESVKAGHITFISNWEQRSVRGAVHHSVYVYPFQDSELIAYHRQLPNRSTYSVYLQRYPGEPGKQPFKPYGWIVNSDGTALCKEMGKDLGSFDQVWGDVFRLDVRLEAVRELQSRLLAKLWHHGIHTVRADMAHFPERMYERYWFDMRERLEKLGASNLKIWGEAYGYSHGNLANAGLASYASFIREWLRDEQYSFLNNFLYGSDGRDSQQFLKINGIVYVRNHDDAYHGDLAREVASTAAIIALPAPIVMFAQGQLEADPLRYGADLHMPWSDFQTHIEETRGAEPDAARLYESLAALASETIFRSPESECRPVIFPGMDPIQDGQKIVYGVRELATIKGKQSILFVVDFERRDEGNPLVINLATSFGLESTQLADRTIINLIDNRTYPLTSFITLPVWRGEVGKNIWFFKLNREG